MQSVLLHPNYSRHTKQNDIALIKLKHPFNSTRFPQISPICLTYDDISRPQKLEFTGFLNGNLRNGSRNEWLETVPFKEYSFDECREQLMNFNIELVDTQVCGMSIGKSDICQGISGGKMIE